MNFRFYFHINCLKWFYDFHGKKRIAFLFLDSKTIVWATTGSQVETNILSYWYMEHTFYAPCYNGKLFDDMVCNYAQLKVQQLKSVPREFVKVVSRLIGLQQKEGTILSPLQTSPLLLRTKIVRHVSQTLVERTLYKSTSTIYWWWYWIFSAMLSDIQCIICRGSVCRLQTGNTY